MTNDAELPQHDNDVVGMFQRLLAQVRSRAARWASTWRRWSRSLHRTAGLASKARMLQLLVLTALLPERARPPARTSVPVKAAAYGQVVWLRPRSRDLAAFDFIEERHHLPIDIGSPIEHIAVLGANIGLLLVDLAARHPAARLLGVEPDAENLTLAHRNVAPLGDRCSLVEAGVWYEDGELELSWTQDAWGLDIAGNTDPGDRRGDTHVVQVVEAGALLDRFTRGRPLDYLLINIESAWYELLRHGAWTRNVRSLKIEIQDHYDEAVPLLEGLGYRAHLQRLEWGAFAVGVRDVEPVRPHK